MTFVLSFRCFDESDDERITALEHRTWNRRLHSIDEERIREAVKASQEIDTAL